MSQCRTVTQKQVFLNLPYNLKCLWQKCFPFFRLEVLNNVFITLCYMKFYHKIVPESGNEICILATIAVFLSFKNNWTKVEIFLKLIVSFFVRISMNQNLSHAIRGGKILRCCYRKKIANTEWHVSSFD